MRTIRQKWFCHLSWKDDDKDYQRWRNKPTCSICKFSYQLIHGQLSTTTQKAWLAVKNVNYLFTLNINFKLQTNNLFSFVCQFNNFTQPDRPTKCSMDRVQNIISIIALDTNFKISQAIYLVFTIFTQHLKNIHFQGNWFSQMAKIFEFGYEWRSEFFYPGCPLQWL